MSEYLGNSNQGRAPLRISQVLSACSFCKSRKIRCDGVTPACGGCTKFGRPGTCSLSSGGTHQARDYPTYLHNRIQRLERALQRLQEDSADTESSSLGLPGSRVTAQVEPYPPSTSVIDTLIADIGALPILASSYSSTGDGPTLSTILLGAASKTPLSLTQRTSHAGPTWMPGREVALKLAQHYVDQVYPRLPFFSIQGFWAQFNIVFPKNVSPFTSDASQSHGERGTADIDQGNSYFTVLIVLAISSSSLSRSADSLISTQAQRLLNRALEYRESAVRPNTIVGVQSLLFLIQYAMLNPSALDAWCLIGVGMRNCIDLGLHQDPHPPDSISPSLLETRRRLWWSMYSFDRSMSLSCGRSTEISDCVIGALLSSFRIESVATEADIQGYLQRYRALQLQSKIYDSLNRKPQRGTIPPDQIIAALKAELDWWEKENIPTYGSKVLVESELSMGKMLLYRPCRIVPERSVEENMELWTASLGFVATYRQLVESNSIFYVQIASEKTYWAGLAILYSFWRLWSLSLSREEVARRTAIVRQTDLWKAIQDVMFILRTLSERWEDGRILAKQFEKTSTFAIAVAESGRNGLSDTLEVPREIQTFRSYASMTSIRASKERDGLIQRDLDLQQFVAEMVEI
uniref:Zn(2)-C6 fungal-type domain-containing protein n=2 Tax=Bionectria ochroleuca TaxID=29856 RepID=A0A0B7KAG6_BIOOC